MPDPSTDHLGLWGAAIAAASMLLVRVGTIVEALRKVFRQPPKRERKETPHDQFAAMLAVLGVIAKTMERIGEDVERQADISSQLLSEIVRNQQDIHTLSVALKAIVDGKSAHVRVTPVGRVATHAR